MPTFHLISRCLAAKLVVDPCTLLNLRSCVFLLGLLGLGIAVTKSHELLS